MRWLADECAAAPLVAALRENGHDVVYIAEVAPRASDAEVLRLARDEARLLLTDDKDFGDLVFRQNWPVAGVVLSGSGRRWRNGAGIVCRLLSNRSARGSRAATR
jgi:predicted nuclease of predicted toxin-antitoxin system